MKVLPDTAGPIPEGIACLICGGPTRTAWTCCGAVHCTACFFSHANANHPTPPPKDPT